jgi:hypothetical protein
LVSKPVEEKNVDVVTDELGADAGTFRGCRRDRILRRMT